MISSILYQKACCRATMSLNSRILAQAYGRWHIQHVRKSTAGYLRQATNLQQWIFRHVAQVIREARRWNMPASFLYRPCFKYWRTMNILPQGDRGACSAREGWGGSLSWFIFVLSSMPFSPHGLAEFSERVFFLAKVGQLGGTPINKPTVPG